MKKPYCPKCGSNKHVKDFGGIEEWICENNSCNIYFTFCPVGSLPENDEVSITDIFPPAGIKMNIDFFKKFNLDKNQMKYVKFVSTPESMVKLLESSDSRAEVSKYILATTGTKMTKKLNLKDGKFRG